MGCDIHVYIEHKMPDKEIWWDFGGRINPGRDYTMFDRMAGVRSYGESNKIVEPRGLPKDISWGTKDDAWLLIVDEENYESNCASKQDALRWVSQGISQYVGRNQSFITHPDWHSHSWLTTEEFKECVETVDGLDNEYKVILATMHCFESLGEKARIVFWFDN